MFCHLPQLSRQDRGWGWHPEHFPQHEKGQSRETEGSKEIMSESMTFPRSHPGSPCIISVPVQLAPVNYCGQTLPRRSLRNEGTNDSSGERCGWILLVILFVLRALLCRNWCITRGTISFRGWGNNLRFLHAIFIVIYSEKKSSSCN